jgi:hypothetical protein
VLFAEFQDSLGSRKMMMQLCKEGFVIGRYRARNLIDLSPALVP